MYFKYDCCVTIPYKELYKHDEIKMNILMNIFINLWPIICLQGNCISCHEAIQVAVYIILNSIPSFTITFIICIYVHCVYTFVTCARSCACVFTSLWSIWLTSVHMQLDFIIFSILIVWLDPANTLHAGVAKMRIYIIVWLIGKNICVHDITRCGSRLYRMLYFYICCVMIRQACYQLPVYCCDSPDQEHQYQ